MSFKLFRFSIISLWLLMLLATDSFAVSNLVLTSISGKGTVEFQPYGSEAWYELSNNSSMALDDTALVSLRALPAPGYEFSSWTGNVNDTSTS